LDGPDQADLHDHVSRVRKIFEGLPLIPSIKAAIAVQNGDDDFARVRPPLVAIGSDHAEAIAEAVRIAGEQTPP
jgi:4-hydroxy-tetrahydrodipicolinate synthase